MESILSLAFRSATASIDESLFLELVNLESQLILLLLTGSDLLIECIFPFVLVLFVDVISGSTTFLILVPGFLLKIGLEPPPIFLIRFLKVFGFSNKGDSLFEQQGKC